jgi:hypothetical protein
MLQLVLSGPGTAGLPALAAGETVIVENWQAECRRAGSLALGAAPEPARQLGPGRARQPVGSRASPNLNLNGPRACTAHSISERGS